VKEAGQLVFAGLAKWDSVKKTAYTVPQSLLDDITTVPRGKTLT
jgi:hypothetical protein